MELVTAKSGQKVLKLSKTDWLNMGKTKGWVTKEALNGMSPFRQLAFTFNLLCQKITELEKRLQAGPNVDAYKTTQSLDPEIIDQIGMNVREITSIMPNLGRDAGWDALIKNDPELADDIKRVAENLVNFPAQLEDAEKTNISTAWKRNLVGIDGHIKRIISKMTPYIGR